MVMSSAYFYQSSKPISSSIINTRNYYKWLKLFRRVQDDESLVVFHKSIIEYTILLVSSFFLMTDLEINMMPQRKPKKADTKKNRTKESPVELTSDQDKQFMPDDIVWAKVVGYPWWPAKVIAKSYPRYIEDEGNSSYKKKEVTYCVEFFGEQAHAYIDDSKVADYLTNRDYFIELAKKQSKKCNADRFNLSVKSADLICQNPDVVSDSQSIVSSPKKNKQKVVNLKLPSKGVEQDVFQEKQVKTKTKKRIQYSENCLKRSSPTHQQAYNKLLRLILRVLLSKNKGKFSYRMLKKIVYLTLKKEKCLKKIKNNNLKDVISLFDCLKSMTIDQIITKFEKKRSFLAQDNQKQEPPQQQTEKPSVVQEKYSSVYEQYTYVDQLGNQSICSLPLKRYDFYIDLN